MQINIKNTKMTSAVIMGLLFFSNQFFGSHNLSNVKYEAPFIGLGVLYVLYLLLKERGLLKYALTRISTLWILAMSVLIFVTGYFTTVNTTAYARSFQLLQLIHLSLIVCIIYFEKDQLEEVLPDAVSVTLFVFSAGIIIYDWQDVYFNLTEGIHSSLIRIGTSPAYGVIQTSMTLSLCMVPILWSIIIEGKRRYIIPALLGLFMITIDISKIGFLSVGITLFVLIIGKAKTPKGRMRNLILFVGAVLAIIIVSYVVPVLRQNLFAYFEEMVKGIMAKDAHDMGNSTSRRMYYLSKALEGFPERPVFGHGLEATTTMLGYDEIEGGFPDAHNNYGQMLYDQGLFGFALYYSLGVYTLIKTIVQKHSKVKLLILCTLFAVLLFDIGNVTYYRNIIGYVAYTAAYIMACRGQYEKQN